MPIGYEKATRLASGDVASRNYFGDDSDGSVTYSSSTNLTVQNKNGSYDGDMLVRNYTNLTINSGVTLTVDQPCRGMLIYVSGDCTINGTLSMTRRGAFYNPTGVSSGGIRLPISISGQTETLSAADFAGCGSAATTAVANQDGISGSGKIYTFHKVGAAGGTIANVKGPSGTAGQSGGGGAGGWDHHAAAAGTCFSGGSASGGGANGTPGQAGGSYGGAGGNGQGMWASGGGAGNPGGSGSYGATAGANGNGGLLILIVGGNLTIGGSGSIESNGGNGGSGAGGSGPERAGGGASGGGPMLVLYAGTLSNSGSIGAIGGTGGMHSGGAKTWFKGGDGGDGYVYGPTQIDK